MLRGGILLPPFDHMVALLRVRFEMEAKKLCGRITLPACGQTILLPLAIPMRFLLVLNLSRLNFFDRTLIIDSPIKFIRSDDLGLYHCVSRQKLCVVVAGFVIEVLPNLLDFVTPST